MTKIFGSPSQLASLVFRTTVDNKTVTVAPGTTLSVASATLTLPDVLTDTLVSRTSTDTLTNKTLTTPVISSISNTGTLTLPTSTDTLVGRATTDTLTNKTIDGDDNTIQDLALAALKTTGNLNVFLQRDGSGDVIDSTKAVPSGDVLGTSDSQTITNKTIDISANTVSNILNTNIGSAAAISVSKLAFITANRVIQTDGTGVLQASSVTNVELGYLSGVSSALQTQIDGKQADVVTTQGDTIIGDGSGDASRLAIGALGTVLTSNGTTASWQTPAGTGNVTAISNITDTALVRGDGGAKGVQTSGILVDGSDNITGVAGLTMSDDLVVNTQDLFVDTSAGFVGIGNASPSAMLDIIKGSTGVVLLGRVTGTSAEGIIDLRGTNTSASGSPQVHLAAYQPTGGANTEAALDLRVRNSTDSIGSPTTVATFEQKSGIRAILAGALAVGVAEPTYSATINSLDVTGASIVRIRTNTGNVDLNGLSGGVAGQIVHIYKSDSTNALNVNHNNGSGTQKIQNVGGATSTLSAGGYGGYTLVCNGTTWFNITNS